MDTDPSSARGQLHTGHRPHMVELICNCRHSRCTSAWQHFVRSSHWYWYPSSLSPYGSIASLHTQQHSHVIRVSQNGHLSTSSLQHPACTTFWQHGRVRLPPSRSHPLQIEQAPKAAGWSWVGDMAPPAHELLPREVGYVHMCTKVGVLP